MPLIPSAIRLPVLRRIGRMLAGAAAMLAATALPAAADTYSCQRYKAELANLSAGADTARALQNEIGRLNAYFRTLNCEGGKFLFFDTRPPQCGAVEQRIRALNAGYGGDNGEVTAARRRQLNAAVASACADQNRPASVTEASLGEARARGGSQVICVRSCDGAYFPMTNLPEGRSGADELCQALCPGAEAAAYSMPHGDDALRQAATIKGSRAYVSLANAFKFQKSFTPNCSCKAEGRTWAQSLVKAESMMVRHKGDIFVTPMQAEAMSRPKVRLTLVGRADKTAASLAADAASRGAAVVSDADPAQAGTTVQRTASAPAEPPPIRIIAPTIIAAPARFGTP
ncbi:hypothetical protein ASG40_02370 [Methylobacterium sp. Leaf399]|uniref:DUF2865 domain-containing protein n=1 Tax=unclassified Methylobacterium TaxID=2615210 RepID=UPI0006F5EE5F|nr:MULTISPECIES: DUF2865 domain-containing protein [unclassified Methylobacterium]KQP61540.1 hypothetical protein ASF39_02355 [Methylobacterium sp. Leaf108]KQT19692.1 hypothetical protein ASG40_02370 [Methylobacterium sp. Leaf399]